MWLQSKHFNSVFRDVIIIIIIIIINIFIIIIIIIIIKIIIIIIIVNASYNLQMNVLSHFGWSSIYSKTDFAGYDDK